MASNKVKLGIISVIAGMNASPLLKSAKRARKGIASFADNAITSMAKIGLAIDGARKAMDLLATPLQLSADLEKTAVSFEVLLGSAEASKKMLDDLQNFAASTPFQFPEISNSAKKLIAFGQSADTVLPTLTRLGNLAAALDVPFEDLADLFGKARVSGRIMTEDLNQFSERGINILGALAEKYGTTAAGVRDMASKGKLSFADLEYAIKRMTDQGGQYFGMMERQSETLSGVWSTFKDNVARILTDVGDEIVKTFNLKDEVKGLTKYLQDSRENIVSFIKSFQPLGDIVPTLKSMVPLAISIAEGLNTMVQGAIAFASGLNDLLGPIGLVTAALVKMSLSNPYTAIATGVIYLTGITRQAAKEQLALNRSVDEFATTRDKAIAVDRKYLEQLQKISENGGFQSSEMEGAGEIIKALENQYGDLGLSINKATGEVEGLTTAFERLDQIQKESNIQMQIRQQEAAIAKLEEYSLARSAFNKLWEKGTATQALFQLAQEPFLQSGMMDEAQQKLAELKAALDELRKPPEAPTATEAPAANAPDAAITKYAENVNKAKDLLVKLRDEIVNLNKTKIETDLEKLIGGEALEKFKKTARVLQTTLDAKKILGEAPVEKFASELARYQELLKSGNLNQEEFAKVARHLADTLLGVKYPTTELEKYNEEIKKLTVARDAGILTDKQFNTKAAEAIPNSVKSAIDSARSPLQKWLVETNKTIEDLKPFGHLIDNFQEVIEGIRFDALPDSIQEALERKDPLKYFNQRWEDIQEMAKNFGLDPKQFQLDAFPKEIARVLEQAKSPLQQFEEKFKAIIPLKDEIISSFGQQGWQAVVDDLQRQVGVSQERKLTGSALAGTKEAADILALSRATTDPTLEIQNKLLIEAEKQTKLMEAGIAFNPFDQFDKAEPLTTDPFAQDTINPFDQFGKAEPLTKDPFDQEAPAKPSPFSNEMLGVLKEMLQETLKQTEYQREQARKPQPQEAPF